MVAKAVLLFCAQALLAQCISSQYLRPGYNGIIADGLAGPFGAPWNVETSLAAIPCAVAPLAAAEWTAFRPTASNGGSFAVTSVSPMAVTGLTMTSENAYEGPLAVAGAMPFLAAVAFDGALPTTGAGAVAYGCGSGNVAILSEGVNAGPYGLGAGIVGDLGYGYAPLGYEAYIAGPRYGYGYNRGCGFGVL